MYERANILYLFYFVPILLQSLHLRILFLLLYAKPPYLIHIEIKYYQEMNVKQESGNELVFCSFFFLNRYICSLIYHIIFFNKILHKNTTSITYYIVISIM